MNSHGAQTARRSAFWQSTERTLGIIQGSTQSTFMRGKSQNKSAAATPNALKRVRSQATRFNEFMMTAVGFIRRREAPSSHLRRRRPKRARTRFSQSNPFQRVCDDSRRIHPAAGGGP
jgi:hypothetical protein